MGAREKVANCLKARDWSAAKAAEKAGVVPSTLRAWLAAQNDKINFQAMVDVCRVLGVSIDWIANDGEPDAPIPDSAWTATVPPPAKAPVPRRLLGPNQDITESVEARSRSQARPKRKPKESGEPEPSAPDGTSTKRR